MKVPCPQALAAPSSALPYREEMRELHGPSRAATAKRNWGRVGAICPCATRFERKALSVPAREDVYRQPWVWQTDWMIPPSRAHPSLPSCKSHSDTATSRETMRAGLRIAGMERRLELRLYQPGYDTTRNHQSYSNPLQTHPKQNGKRLPTQRSWSLITYGNDSHDGRTTRNRWFEPLAISRTLSRCVLRNPVVRSHVGERGKLVGCNWI
jgi:hypothetical protein